MSLHRLGQVFRADVGLSPNQYLRVRRLMGVIRRLQKGTRINWADLAVACGYYDQAHLINEFHAIAGVCPSVYLRDRHPRFPHLLDPSRLRRSL